MLDIKNRVRLIILTTMTVASLSGCGGDDGPAATAATSPKAASENGNSLPQLTGTPSTAVLNGTAYSFKPQASDADGHALSFSVANLPRWAKFDPSSGTLTGTPGPSDVGTYDDIRITVTDGHTPVSLAPFRINVTNAAANSVILNWSHATETTDGEPLGNLGGYRVYWGTSEGMYPHSTMIDNPGLASYVIEQLAPAHWFFVVTAVTTAGIESTFSNVASLTVN